MKCSHCDFSTGEMLSFCPNCGAPLIPDDTPSSSVSECVADGGRQNSGSRILAVLQDKLFLAVCILVSALTGLSIFSLSINVIGILLTIFMWMVYAAARRGGVDVARLRCISGTYFAYKVVLIVACSIMIASMLIMLIVLPVIAGSVDMDYLASILERGFAQAFGSSGWIVGVLSGFFAVFMVVFLLISVAGLVITLIGVNKIHRFLRSVYMHEQDGSIPYECVREAKGWCMALGIITCVLSVITGGFLTGGCAGAAYILLSVLIGKYLPDAK